MAFITYDHKEYIVDNTKYLVHSPSNHVLNANIPELDTIETFESDIFDEIYLLAGKEPDYDLRHILARYSLSSYFLSL
ncbi:MAG: hypothetical protein B6I20_10820 [Bacteroidetes bacterium 4572_117]|nr:MAG: hypothetical protein B6I20_10820 [Bacteroidetes bacterium 4572_117]